jgi:hypothetical protein
VEVEIHYHMMQVLLHTYKMNRNDPSARLRRVFIRLKAGFDGKKFCEISVSA